jgi:ATP-dependent exoDNAse (exonuclease V) alpha subunit
MLARLRSGRGATAPIADSLEVTRVVAAAEEASRALGHEWTADQREATRTLLTARDRVSALQGLAGTAKTSTVLATFAEAARARGFVVMPLATTGSAASTLGAALGSEAQTVDRFLGQLAADVAPAGRRQVWMVDEASMLSARLTARLLTAAEARGARVVLVGDTRQLGSVEAGAAFRQLQEHGLTTARLETIVRQTNAATREAVYAAAQGNPAAALRRLEQGGGSITEASTPEERRKALAEGYVQALLPAIERHGEDVAAAFAQVLAIDPSREGREALTQEIRGRLKEAGIITREELRVTALERRDLTREEAEDALRYRVGDVIRFGGPAPRHGIAKGEHLRVAKIDPLANALTIERADGGRLVRSPHLRGSRAHVMTVFTARDRGLAEGERITLTRNDPRGWTNGTTAIALAVDPVAREARLRLDDGRMATLRLDEPCDQHWRHGYVETAYGAQGRTTGEVFAHAESWRVNLVTQQSLYVLLSRAKQAAHLYTDSREQLAHALASRSGQRATALETDRASERRAAGREIGLVLSRIAARTMRQMQLLTERIAATLQRIRGLAGEQAEPAQQRQPTRRASSQNPIRQPLLPKASPAQPVLERSR